MLCVLVRTRCAQCSVGTLHCLPALVPGSGEGTALSRSPFRSLAQAQTESVFSSSCLCICSLGPACESSNFLNSPPLTVSRPSATLSLGRVVARVCAGFALYSFISFTYFFYVCILSLRFIAECCPLNLYLPFSHSIIIDIQLHVATGLKLVCHFKDPSLYTHCIP